MRGRKPSKRWWKGFEHLYGDSEAQIELPLATVRSGSAVAFSGAVKKKKSGGIEVRSEDAEQFILVNWLLRHQIPHHHSPNGGYREIAEAAKFKRLGVSAGFPDIFIPVPRKGCGGLFIELKRVSGGRLSEAQRGWGDLLIKNGFAWHEAHGSEVAIRIVMDYFGMLDGMKEQGS